MKAFEAFSSVAAPLLLDNVDTEVIVRVEPLFSGVPRHELGPYALAALRLRGDQTEDPDCVLNQVPWRSAGILLAGRNFGCGSSREGAVWALMARGIRCIVAPSFGQIFQSNCFLNGLLPVCLAPETVVHFGALARAVPEALFSVDLEGGRIVAPDGKAYPFVIPNRYRDALLKGLDEIDLTLNQMDRITEFEQRDAQRNPWLHRTSPQETT